MAAPIIRAIDQKTANASRSHFTERDFLAGEDGHTRLKRGKGGQAIAPRFSPSDA
jgi:hypothetical protein